MPENTIIAAGGMSEYERRKKAESQPRDGRGRWIRDGAFVRWRSEGQDWAGTVESIENGIATVTAKMKDGSTTTRTLQTDSLSVTASKARLSSYAKSFRDDKNSTDRFLGENRPAIEEAAESGGALIEREDGYSVEVGKGQPIDGDGDGELNEAENSEDAPGTEEEDKDGKSPGNPLVFQLYAPRSSNNSGSGETAAPSTGGAPIGIYSDSVSIDEVIEDHKDFNTPEGSDEAPAPAAEAPVVASTEPQSFSVPKAVREAVTLALKAPDKFTGDGLEHAKRLSVNTQVGLSDVQWVYDYFSEIEDVEDFYGGYPGRKWATKIIDSEEYDPIEHDFEVSNLEYYAVASDYDLDNFNGLIGVDFTANEVYAWDGKTFVGPVATADDYEADMLEPVDEITAREIGYMLHDDKYATFNTMDIFPEERNLFAMAASALDWDFYGNLNKFVYESQDRSVDASSQARGSGGKFGTPNIGVAQVEGTPEENTTDSVNQASTEAETEQQETGNSDPLSTAKYFAIVDEIDQSAVADIVVISSANGQPAAFRRTQGQWTLDADMLTKLSGATPPPVVALTDEAEIKDVLSQIDSYDSGEDTTESEFSTKDYSMYGPNGEIVAAGVPGVADAPSDWAAVARLKKYWLHGPGLAKWRPNTPGDLTRLAKHLGKYVSNPWAVAHAWYIEKFGESNYKRDNG